MKMSESMSSQTMAGSEALFSSTTLLTQVGTGLVIVLLVFIAGVKLINKFPFFSRVRIKQNNIISVKSNLSLGQQGRLVVVEFNHQLLLLGVSSNSIRCLAKMKKSDKEIPDDTIFKEMFKKVSDHKDADDEF